MSLPFQNPIIIKSLSLPIRAGSLAPLRLGAAQISFLWETWSTIESLLADAQAGTVLSVTIAGYSGSAVIPPDKGVTFQAVAGADAPQSEIVDTALDLFSGELNLILI